MTDQQQTKPTDSIANCSTNTSFIEHDNHHSHIEVPLEASYTSTCSSLSTTFHIAIQAVPQTADAWTQYDYDDIYESVGELNYSIRESTPIGAAAAAAATMSSFEDISVIQDISLMSEYHPSLEEVTNDDSTAASLDTSTSSNHLITHERKFFVFESCLDQLIRRCPTCGKAILNKRKFVVGSCLSVITERCGDHTVKWVSQTSIRGMASGNLLMSASILFSGSTYDKFAHLSELLNLQILSRSEFYRIPCCC